MAWLDEVPGFSAAAEPFLARLRAALERWPAPEPGRSVTVAFSGGLDSTVLLAALSRLRLRSPLRAAHVDHGLHADSARWSAHCATVAAELGAAFVGVRVEVDRAAKVGLEAAARAARYAALARLMSSGEVLLTAHHGDDQLETLLLRLMRGTGVRGLSGIPEHAPFAGGWLARPLLDFTRAEILDRGRAWGLRWLEDPANAELRHDRNFLRREVVPRLVARWPAAARSAQRLAEQAAEADRIIDELAELDAGGSTDLRRMPRAVLAPLDEPRQRNLLRYALRKLDLPAPSSRKLEEVRAAFLDARPDAQPHLRWPGAEARVHRGHLYLMRPLTPASAPDYRARLDARSRWTGPEGDLHFEAVASGAGLPESWLESGLELRFRAGGEDFRPLDRAHGHELKRWLQEAAIVPWMRSRIPLLFRTDRLVAVGDLWLAEDTRLAHDEPRWRVVWSHHPPLH
jgi:tRNA(Ile)-lysidine synthase